MRPNPLIKLKRPYEKPRVKPHILDLKASKNPADP
jgi:hypothetical protein